MPDALRRLALFALIMLLAGCQAILPLFYPKEAQYAAQAQPRTATINLTVHWPTGPGRDFRGYHAQIIPDSTSLILATVKNGATAVGASAKIRATGQTSVNIPVTVPVGNGYSLEVFAYPATNAPSANGGAIAQASIVGTLNTLGLTLATQHTLSVSVTLASMYVPVITGLSAQAGNVGHAIEITGTNLAPGWEIALPVVYFNGTAATTVTRQSAGAITATVPAGATVGNIVVKADGVSSTSTANYWVVTSRSVTTTSPQIHGNTVANGLVYYSGTLDYTATLDFAVKSGESLATYTGRPAVAWTVSGASHTIASQGDATPDGDTVTSVGRLTAASGYSSGIAVATLGTATANFLARSVGVDSISLGDSLFTINALPPSGQSVSATYLSSTFRDTTATVNHTLPFNEGVSWSTSDGQLAAINQTTGAARITTTQGAVAASRTFTATSITNGSRTAVGNVTVTDFGQLLLGVQ
jgi:hypothetical protein